MYFRAPYKTVTEGRIPANEGCLAGAANYMEVSNCLVDTYGWVKAGNGIIFETWIDTLVTKFYPNATPDQYTATAVVDHVTLVNFIGTGVNFSHNGNFEIKNSIAAYCDTTSGKKAFYVGSIRDTLNLISKIHDVLYRVDENDGTWNSATWSDTSWNVLADVNPMFVDPENSDYSLQDGSAAKGAGDDGKDLGYLGDIATAIQNEVVQQVPQTYSLNQNYPNPFNPTTTIRYNIPKSENVRISVYNVLGQEVAVLLNEKVNAGNHTVEFKAANLSSGIYIYRMEAGSFTSYKKMIIMK